MLRKLITAAIVGNFVYMLASVLAPISNWKGNSVIADINNDTTVTYGASANVSEFLELNAELHPLIQTGPNEWDINWGVNATSLAYGTLSEREGAGGLWGENGYAAVFFPVSSGRRYQILWTGTVLTGPGGAQIGAGADNQTGSTVDAYLVQPDYVYQDKWEGQWEQGSCDGCRVGEIAKVASTNEDVFTSNNAGEGAIVRAYLGVTGIPQGTWVNYSEGRDGDTGIGNSQPYVYGSFWDVVTTSQRAGSYTGSVTFTLNLIS